MNRRHAYAAWFFLTAVLVLSACALQPMRPGGGYAGPDPYASGGRDIPAEARAKRVADVALAMVGTPYVYGGASPRGFDCSGLAQYSYARAGRKLSRTTYTQRDEGMRVGSTPRVGDLVFFDQEGKGASHVGIYIGNNRFVHAPSSGKTVRVDNLTDAYWQRSFVDARRYF